MTGYVKGTTPDGEIAHMDESLYRATAAIRAWPDVAQAWESAKALAKLVEKLRTETADFRDWLAAYMADDRGLTHEELAAFMGVSRAAVSQRIARAREKGYPVTEPATLPEQPHVGLAIITPEQLIQVPRPGATEPRHQVMVLIAKRRDGIPPWTFLAGDVHEGESAGDALRRRVQAESGLTVESIQFIGRRIHPKTSRRWFTATSESQRANRRSATRRTWRRSGGSPSMRPPDPYAGYVRAGTAVPGLAAAPATGGLSDRALTMRHRTHERKESRWPGSARRR